MPRMRYLGRPAANADDVLTLRQLTAFGAALPGQYLELSRLNQPNGVPQLDANSRMGNTYLPTDIARSTFTASGKVKGGSGEFTGAATVGDTLSVTNGISAASLSLTGNVSAGGNATITGAISGASLTVGTGPITAGTADIPEITSTNFKAKATTLASLSVTGAATVGGALSVTGNISGAAISGSGVTSSGDISTATGTITGATVRSTGSLIADGAASAQSLTVSQATQLNTLTNTGLITANAGLRIGNGQNISQVDNAGNGVPVALANGLSTGTITASGAFSGATLSLSGAATMASTLSVSGKVTAADLESQAGLRINGALTGVTNLTVTGNITANTNNTQVNTFKITSLSAELSGQFTWASGMTSTQVHGYINGKSVRQYGDRWERFSAIDSGNTWQPNLAFSGQARTSSYQQGFAPNQDTIVDSWDTNLHGTNDHFGAVINAGNVGFYGRATGVYLATFKMTLNMYVGRHYQTYFTVNGSRRTETFLEGTTGGGPASNNTADDYTTIQNIHVMRLTAGDIVRVVVQQRMGEKTSYPINNSFDRPEFSLTYLGAY